MNESNASTVIRTALPAKHKLSRGTVFLVGDLLPLCDFIGVLLAAYCATLAYGYGLSPTATFDLWTDITPAALVAAILAPLLLCDRAFVSFANSGQTASLIRCYAVRFGMFAGVVAILGFASRALENLPQLLLALWLASALLITALIRGVLVANLRRLERTGVLTETVAVVCAGPLADRLIEHLHETRGRSVEILGVFDDRAGCSEGCAHPPTGSITDLIGLGQSQSIDWILLALPATADARDDEALNAMVHRLKALAVPIGLCQQDGDDEDAPTPSALNTGAGLSIVTSAPERPHTMRTSFSAAAETVLPPWIMTLLGLPLAAIRLIAAARVARTQRRSSLQPLAKVLPTRQKLEFSLDNYDLDQFTTVAARFGQQRYGYVVTPNADHLIRLHREPAFRALYADAAYVLLDSRFIAKLLHHTQKRQLPVCTGSDLTARLFEEVITHDDHLVMIGGSEAQAASLSERYGLKQLAHFNPPMGFIHDPAAVETCLQFIEAHSPFRYCLLAVGAPQQETIAQLLKTRGIARGMALCIGASVNFLTGDEQRAPLWMQRRGLEWLFRLLQAPGRMAGRYLVRGPQVFGLLRHTEITLRTAAHESPQAIAPPIPRPPRTATAPLTRLPVTAVSGRGKKRTSHAQPVDHAH